MTKAEVNYENDKALEQQPCEDAVSREDRIKDLIGAIENDDCNYWTPTKIASALKQLPSVTPSRRKGHWIAEELQLPDRMILNYHCSVCGRKLVGYSTKTLKEAPFCHCGAEMESKE